MDLMDYRRKIIMSSPHLSHAEGAVASFSDGTDLPLNSLLVDIDPVQSGSGDPSPTNIRPISGWNGVKVTRCGKNLSPINENNESPRTYWGTNWTELIAVLNTLPVGVYTISNKFTVSTLPNNGQVAHGRIYITAMVNGTQRGLTSYSVTNDTSPTVGKVYQESGTFTITEEIRGNINHAYLYCDSTDHSASSTDKGTYTLTDVQIELGSTATPYEPYQGQPITVQLGQTVYGGTLNVLTGVLTVDRLGVPMESLTWYRSTSYANPLFYATVTGKASDYRKACCSMFRNIGSATIIAAQGFSSQSADGNFASSNGNAQIFVRLDSATTVQAFVTAVTGQTIVYPLANSTTIQLTPHQIRSLYGNNTIFADTGNTSLEYWAHP